MVAEDPGRLVSVAVVAVVGDERLELLDDRGRTDVVDMSEESIPGRCVAESEDRTDIAAEENVNGGCRVRAQAYESWTKATHISHDDNEECTKIAQKNRRRCSVSNYYYTTPYMTADLPPSAVSDAVVNDTFAPTANDMPRRLSTPHAHTGASLVVIAPTDPVFGASIGDSPEWTVGLGWYIYVYLNRGDWFWLAGLPRTVATSVLCGWLTPTVGPAIACALAMYIATTPLVAWTAPPSGYC